jgi:hypothetical protein
MARKVFFSFDYDDVMAANIVRNSNVVRGPDKQLDDLPDRPQHRRVVDK